MADFRAEFGDFSSTSIRVEAISESGRALFAAMFGAGAVSVELQKSTGADFARFVSQKGLTII